MNEANANANANTDSGPAVGSDPADELPLFPAEGPQVFHDVEATKALLAPVLAGLADAVEVDPGDLPKPTPCADYSVAELRRHVLAWLQFFSAAAADPDGRADRIDPESWELAPGESARAIVEQAGVDLIAAIDADVADKVVVMAQARMAGHAVLAMALGEYLVHGWDLSVATGREWLAASDQASEPALAFLQTTVAPEYRGPDSGFFDHEIAAPPDATAFERLLCFTGRTPDWTPAG